MVERDRRKTRCRKEPGGKNIWWKETGGKNRCRKETRGKKDVGKIQEEKADVGKIQEENADIGKNTREKEIGRTLVKHSYCVGKGQKGKTAAGKSQK